jgi:hypothetical protein
LNQQLRRELGYMFYVYKIILIIFISNRLKFKDSSLKNRGPRKITVVMPSLDENGEARIIRPISVKSMFKLLTRDFIIKKY